MDALYEASFQDGVIESSEALELNIDVLNSLAAQSTSHRAFLFESSRSIERIIGNVDESDRIRKVGNKAAAVDVFAFKGDDIFPAKWEAHQLRIEIIRSIADRMWSASSSNTLLDLCLIDLFGNKYTETITSSIGGVRGRATVSKALRPREKQ